MLMLLPFCNGLYILNSHRESLDEDTSLVGIFSGVRYLDTIYHQYFVTLGELGSENFNLVGNYNEQFVLWTFLFFSTLISQITMLNMMVTIMSEPFNELNPIKSSVITYTRMRLMYSHINLRDMFWAKWIGINTEKSEYQNYIYLVEPDLDEIPVVEVSDQITALKDGLLEKIDKLDRKLNESSQILQKDVTNQNDRLRYHLKK